MLFVETIANYIRSSTGCNVALTLEWQLSCGIFVVAINCNSFVFLFFSPPPPLCFFNRADEHLSSLRLSLDFLAISQTLQKFIAIQFIGLSRKFKQVIFKTGGLLLLRGARSCNSRPLPSETLRREEDLLPREERNYPSLSSKADGASPTKQARHYRGSLRSLLAPFFRVETPVKSSRNSHTYALVSIQMFNFSMF